MTSWGLFLFTFNPEFTLFLGLLKFYDFPAEHWQSIRTTNPIESTFSIIRHRTIKSKGCFSRDTIMGSVFKLTIEAEKSFRKLYVLENYIDIT